MRNNKYNPIQVEGGYESGELFNVVISGRVACFTQPEFTAERFSSLIPSHSAANGILKAFLSKYGMSYSIKYLGFLTIPQHINIVINEITNFGNGKKPVNVSSHRTLRNTHALANVKYIMGFRIFTENSIDLGKFSNMLNRRLPKITNDDSLGNAGGTWNHIPYLGIKEYVCKVNRCNPSDVEPEDKRFPIATHNVEGENIRTVDYTVPLGISFYGTDYDDSTNYFTPMFISNGLVTYPSWPEVKKQGIILRTKNVATA